MANGFWGQNKRIGHYRVLLKLVGALKFLIAPFGVNATALTKKLFSSKTLILRQTQQEIETMTDKFTN